MQYLVQMRLVPQGRPTTTEDGIAFIEQHIFPTLELSKKPQEEKKILAGRSVSGAIALAFIVSADSAKELDDVVTGLPVWALMETEVTPLTTFDALMQSLLPRLENLKAQARKTEGSRQGGDR